MSKYRAIKTTIDNITFDSRKEAEYYLYLKSELQAHRIYDLKLQPKYELIPKFEKDGKHYRSASYIADFEYKDEKGTHVVDVKGMKTPIYILKKKLFEYTYKDYHIEEV